MTGLDPWSLNMFGNVEGKSLPGEENLAGSLSDAGYQTHAVGKLHTYPERARLGFHEAEIDEEYRTLSTGKFMIMNSICEIRVLVTVRRVTELVRSIWRLDSIPRTQPTHWVGDRACNFIERRDPTRPFSLRQFRQPHPPFVVQPAF